MRNDLLTAEQKLQKSLSTTKQVYPKIKEIGIARTEEPPKLHQVGGEIKPASGYLGNMGIFNGI